MSHPRVPKRGNALRLPQRGWMPSSQGGTVLPQRDHWSPGLPPSAIYHSSWPQTLKHSHLLHWSRQNMRFWVVSRRVDLSNHLLWNAWLRIPWDHWKKRIRRKRRCVVRGNPHLLATYREGSFWERGSGICHAWHHQCNISSIQVGSRSLPFMSCLSPEVTEFVEAILQKDPT